MATTVENYLDKNFISAVIDQDLKDMFNPEANVEQTVKDKIKEEAVKASDSFIEFVKFHTINKDLDEDEYWEQIYPIFDLFKGKLEEILSQNIKDEKNWGSIYMIWLGFYIKLKNIGKESGDTLLFDVANWGHTELIKLHKQIKLQ